MIMSLTSVFLFVCCCCHLFVWLDLTWDLSVVPQIVSSKNEHIPRALVNSLIIPKTHTFVPCLKLNQMNKIVPAVRVVTAA